MLHPGQTTFQSGSGILRRIPSAFLSACFSRFDSFSETGVFRQQLVQLVLPEQFRTHASFRARTLVHRCPKKFPWAFAEGTSPQTRRCSCDTRGAHGDSLIRSAERLLVNCELKAYDRTLSGSRLHSSHFIALSAERR